MPNAHRPIARVRSSRCSISRRRRSPRRTALFVEVLAEAGPAQPLLALVDESAFRARWPGDDRRLAQRRGMWSELLTAQRVAPIFVDLAAPDLAFAEAAIDAALSARTRIEPAAPASLVTDRPADRAVADLAHECGQDHARADAALPRCRRGPRCPARHDRGRFLSAGRHGGRRCLDSLGHARLRRQCTPRAAAAAAGQSRRLVPVASVGSLPRPVRSG